MSIKVAKSIHVKGILNIYKAAVENTAASFALSAHSIDEMMIEIEKTTKKYPWLVYEI